MGFDDHLTDVRDGQKFSSRRGKLTLVLKLFGDDAVRGARMVA